jgi:protoheme ferro-lyase
MQYVSLDSGQSSHAEYIRHGLDFDRLRKNVERYLTEVPGYNSLTFIVTMNNLSVLGFRDLMTWILELRAKHNSNYQRIWFDTPVLRQPEWQSLQLLPESYAYKLEQCMKWMSTKITTDLVGFRDFEVQRLQRDIAWMRQGQQSNWAQAKADFFRFFSEHDRRRNTSFTTVFPEMTAWWKECENHARQS